MRQENRTQITTIATTIDTIMRKYDEIPFALWLMFLQVPRVLCHIVFFRLFIIGTCHSKNIYFGLFLFIKFKFKNFLVIGH